MLKIKRLSADDALLASNVAIRLGYAQLGAPQRLIGVWAWAPTRRIAERATAPTRSEISFIESISTSRGPSAGESSS